MKIAYLINQYPKISHSFIRREILALEKLGVDIFRVSMRSCENELIDIADKQEFTKTFTILNLHPFVIFYNLIVCFLSHPILFLKALSMAIELGKSSEVGQVRHLIYLAESCALTNQLKKSNLTHIHAHFGTNSATTTLLTSILGHFTYSFTVHGPEEFDKPQSLSLTTKIKYATFVVAISSFARGQLYRWCPYAEWSKIKVVHCGLDEDFLDTPILPIPPTSQLLCIGRLTEQKGQGLLIKALAKIKQKGLNFKLLLVGDGPLRPTLEELIVSLELQDFVKIKGWATSQEIKQFFHESRALVLPSFAEGLPVVMIESFALGRPVIATYIAGNVELMENNLSGFLVPSGDIEALADAIEKMLLLDIDQLEAMAMIGNQRVKENHNSMIEARKLMVLFEEVTKSQN
jgi:glycosyltransferase involved in cell wall biosynthesis